jgi:hypothetical protein
MSRLKNFRQAETLAELDRLRTELTEWLKQRRGADSRGQYATQLNVLEGEVCTAIQALRDWVLRAFGPLSTGDVFRQLAADDRRIIWIRDAWNYYRQKFDQREAAGLQTVLRAADEVVWSCYKPFFNGGAVPPAPLCCVDSSYVPSSIRPDQARHQLGRTSEIDTGVLAPFFQSLPIPVLRLPPGVASSPWLLSLIGHETGHFIQRLFPDVSNWLSDQIENAAARCGGTDADKAAWRNYAEEIFADLYFVLAVGPWAIWALAPWSVGPDATMVTRERYYPAPLVRLRLMARTAEALGLVGAEALRSELVGPLNDAIQSDETRLDLRIAEQVGSLICSPLRDGHRSLADRITFRASDFANDAIVDRWSAALSGGPPRADDHDLRTARLVCAAALKSSHDAAAIEESGEQEERLAKLRDETPKRIAACFETSRRAAPQVAAPSRGSDLARLVLDASEDALMQQ